MKFIDYRHGHEVNIREKNKNKTTQKKNDLSYLVIQCISLESLGYMTLSY